ncbi:Cyclin-related protein FAM58A [Trichoplax sp. H2]|uniref:Cyclin-Q n=1 Tax=Trichoplax adhaerens TaxID=10228 RepID=B3RR46_TRIAD|nr:hypothetical protein TRIADDRAFT_54106 [Trichoplax adhaerens]EDV26279.1 hypothetical protein TRIADDRAFT_54106 [Trichoplax adhaerens]RDD45171.1 Cyclin-related protein FAM58A [Trichoplax sp. H2]|eukprot:XP_002110275.1 hypothetical protein TRIADDRAFT_54106 [Trichoplax adhaerens]
MADGGEKSKVVMPPVVKISAQQLIEDKDHWPEYLKIGKFIAESGIKLKLGSVVIARAATIYHRFYFLCDISQFDRYLVAVTCLYLASKVEDTPRRARDVITTSYKVLHKEKPILKVDSFYWQLRDSVVNFELFMLRMLKFDVSSELPHKYLLHYLKSLQDWCGESNWTTNHINQLCWQLLQDTSLLPFILLYPPSVIATAVIYLAVKCNNIEVPSEGSTKPWWNVFSPNLNEEGLQQLCYKFMELYDT